MRGEGRGVGERSGSFVRVLRVLEALGGSFVRVLRVWEAPGGPGPNGPNTAGGSAKEGPHACGGSGAAHLYVFYVSWRLREAHLYVFYVSGRLRGGTDSGNL